MRKVSTPYPVVSYNKKIRDALRDLVPFLQFNKRKKYPCRSDTFIKVAGNGTLGVRWLNLSIKSAFNHFKD